MCQWCVGKGGAVFVLLYCLGVAGRLLLLLASHSHLLKMSAPLEIICGGLPVSPLPEPRGRSDAFPHAPVRNPCLTPDEKRVS